MLDRDIKNLRATQACTNMKWQGRGVESRLLEYSIHVDHPQERNLIAQGSISTLRYRSGDSFRCIGDRGLKGSVPVDQKTVACYNFCMKKRYIPILVLVLVFTLAACGNDRDKDPTGPRSPEVDTTCAGLYGRPNENTGLDTDVCFPRIEGEETWTPRAWDAAAFEELLSWTLENPPAGPAENPYETTPDLQPEENAVCAVMVTGDHTYRLETFSQPSVAASIRAARAAGGIITHGTACGACSSLANLEVYARIPDQTDPIRTCSFINLGRPVEDIDACIQDAVGFTPPCSRAWAYNAINDSEHCLWICIVSLVKAEPYNLEDGSINGCLQCDEDVSGPVFKATAGRTRRNSGLAAAICRPCETVWRIDHVYD